MTGPVRTSLPRRANGIRMLAAQMAGKKLNEINARQAVSDRIGYAVATCIGAAVWAYGGPHWLFGLLVLYAVSGVRAYHRYRTLKDGA